MLPAIRAIQQTLSQANKVLVITHINPDGDALGALTATGLALEQLGKRATLVCDDRVSERFRFLPLADQVQKAPTANVDYDLIAAVDCGDELRMGRAYADLPEPRPKVINIDHHITNTEFGAINLIDPQAASTTEILYQLFTELDLMVTADMALSLLTGLVTDTLGFRTVGVTATTLAIAGALMEAGADLSLVTMQALSLKPLSTLLLWRVGLNNMKLEEGLLWTSISYNEQESIAYVSSGTTGLVNLLADVEEAAMSAVLMEMSDGAVRVGFRCRPPYSVAELALNLGGGGHPLAAGCTLEGPLARAEELVVQLSKEEIRQQEAFLEI
ncbi:MAG TPA: bifunctional oligoribonuclease/PAP phosphatase NrnA [Anaerolineae bacterium]